MRLAGGFQPCRPVGQHRAPRRIRLGVDGHGELADFTRLDGQVDGADRRHFGLRLDRFDRAAHADHPVEQPLPQRPELPAVVGQLGKALVEDGDAVEYAVEIALQMNRRRFGPFGAGRGHGDQMAGEVAAVDARHVERIERPERRRLVPVEQMAAMALHLLDGRDRRVDARGRVGQADPAEIARRDDRQQIDADIGRRGSAAPRPDAAFPGNCPAADDCARPSRRSRNRPRCAARWCAAPPCRQATRAGGPPSRPTG